MLIPAVLNLPSAISPLWSRNAVSLHSYFPLKSLSWAELFLIALICCILGWRGWSRVTTAPCPPAWLQPCSPLGSITQPCPLPTRLCCKQALAAAHTAPSSAHAEATILCADSETKHPAAKPEYSPLPGSLSFMDQEVRQKPLGVRWNPASWQNCPAMV